MNPFLVGGWDGTNLWLQWDEVPGVRYDAQFSFRWAGADWSEWTPAAETRVPWLVFDPARPPGIEVRAQVRAGSGEWHPAVEATFTRSRCLFRFAAGRADIYHPEGVMIHAAVDGAACSYRLPVEVSVPAGEVCDVELHAVASGGWAQLDRPGDFRVRPSHGEVIENIAPSTHDVAVTGRDYTVLQMAQRDGPFTVVNLPATNLR